MDRSFIKTAPYPENPRLAEWGGGAANMDLSDLTLARQRAYRGHGGKDSYFEVECAPGARCAGKAGLGLAS